MIFEKNHQRNFRKTTGVVKMYQEEYKRWMAADLEDPDLKPEL